MARDIIIEKLNTLLTSKQPFEEECQVLYLMVEIYKAIEIKDKDDTNYRLLKYYRDWLVHPKKDINHNIKTTIELFYKSAKQYLEEGSIFLESNNVVDFLQLTELQRELIHFFSIELLPPDLFKNEMFWMAYIKLMYSILSDQPIVNPTNEVSSIIFSYKESGILGKINFTKRIKGADGKDHKDYDFYYRLTIKSLENII